MSRVAVVTGSNKGIGLAIVKGLCQRFDGVVYLTSRDEKRGQDAVELLKKKGLSPKYFQLNVADRNSVLKFRDHIKENEGGIDILVNNAAVANSGSLHNPHEVNKEIIDINYRSILTVQELLFPLIRDNGRIVNISSDCGHLSNVRNNTWIKRLSHDNLKVEDINEFVDWYLNADRNGTFSSDDLADNGTIAAYRIAKVALSAVTRVQQKALESRNIAVNSMHPGLVRTDMTCGVGFYSTDQAAETPLYLALDAPQTLKGAYVWYDRRALDWLDYNADYYFKSETLKG